jgi:hypothetical protein
MKVPPKALERVRRNPGGRFSCQRPWQALSWCRLAFVCQNSDKGLSASLDSLSPWQQSHRAPADAELAASDVAAFFAIPLWTRVHNLFLSASMVLARLPLPFLGCWFQLLLAHCGSTAPRTRRSRRTAKSAGDGTGDMPTASLKVPLPLKLWGPRTPNQPASARPAPSQSYPRSSERR